MHSAGGARDPSVLLVDSDHELRDALVDAFDLLGVEAAVAADGAGALRTLQRSVTPPDLVLLELSLPKLSGFELIREVRADPRLSACRIVAMTALPCAARVSGADRLLRKPFRIAELARLTRELSATRPG